MANTLFLRLEGPLQAWESGRSGASATQLLSPPNRGLWGCWDAPWG